MIENCIRNSLLSYQCAVSCRRGVCIYTIRLVVLFVCTCMSTCTDVTHFCQFSPRLQFDHFGQFSCYTSHMIRTIYYHCASCKMLIHFIQTHNFDNTLIFVVLFALFLLLIFDVIRAEDRCIMHVYMRCDFNLIIIIANMQCEWYDLVELIFFEWNWMNIWDATICNCRCKWKEKV